MSAVVEPAAGPFRLRDLILFDVGLASIFDPDVGKIAKSKPSCLPGRMTDREPSGLRRTKYCW